MFFLAKLFVLVAVVAIVVRAGMHVQQLTAKGISPWDGHGIELVGGMLRADLDSLPIPAWTASSPTR